VFFHQQHLALSAGNTNQRTPPSGARYGNDYFVELVCELRVKEMQLTYPAISAITKGLIFLLA
jgi:hypothetical protein